jgi:transmembrane 9 superfamily member 2/4
MCFSFYLFIYLILKLFHLQLDIFIGVLFSGFFILNLFVWGAGSSGAVPFSTLVALLVLWLGISVPLVYLGSYLALQQKPIEPPVKVHT